MAGIKRQISREVKNIIGSLKVFPDFKPGWRKEGEENPDIGILLSDGFYNRTSLFNLAQGGTMNPYDRLCLFFERLLYLPEYMLSSLDPLPGLGIEKCSYAYD